MLSVIVVSVALLIAGHQSVVPPNARDPIDVMAEFDSVCLAWDGVTNDIADVALRRRYVAAPERVPEDLFQGSSLRVWLKTDDVSEAMVVTQNSTLTFGTAVKVKQCYISFTPGDLRATRAALREHLGFDGFRQEDTLIFAWTPSEDGGHDRIRRNTFERDFIRQMTDHGMRYISLAQHDDQVILGYVAPRDAPTAQAPSLIE